MTRAAPIETSLLGESPRELVSANRSPSDREAGVDGAVCPLDDALYDLLRRQLYSLTAGRAPDLEDLVQSAAMEVVRSYPSFQRRAALSTWTYSICYRTVLQRQRWYRRWLQRFSSASDLVLADHADERDGADAQLERAERVHRLRSAVARLSPKRRAVVVLRDLEGLGIPEVSAIVGANEHTVRSRLRDARRQLARILREDPYFGEEAVRAAEATDE